MRPGKHAKRAVLETAIIEMDAYRQHAGKNLRRRLHLPNAGLVRPAGIASDINARRDRDHIVLVPEQ